jgi:hypothetical protein
MEFAKKSMRRAQREICLNVVLLGAFIVYFFFKTHPTGTQKYWLLGGTALYILVSLSQWLWIRKEKFRRVKVYSHQWPLVLFRHGNHNYFTPRLSTLWGITFVILLVLLCVYGAYDVWLLILYIFLDEVVGLPTFREKIEVGQDKLKIIRTLTNEIPYANIEKVTCPEGIMRSLRIYVSEPMPSTIAFLFEKDKFDNLTDYDISVECYRAHDVAAILGAIQQHAPQAKFDTGADLMRRCYFSW